MKANEIEAAVKARFDDIEEDIDIEVTEFFSEHNNEDRYSIKVTIFGITTYYEIRIDEPEQAVENTIDAIDSAVREQL